MTSKKRVFSNSNEIMHYTDYVKNKNALVILSTIKHNTNFVKNYRNYDEFIKLSKIYSKYLNCNDPGYKTNCVQEYTTNLYSANNSYINNRINKHNPNYLCGIFKNDMYPYGINYNNSTHNIKLTSNLYLDNWIPCNNPCNNPIINCDCLPIKPHRNNLNSKDVTHKNINSKDVTHKNINSNDINKNINSNDINSKDVTHKNINSKDVNSNNVHKCKTGLCKNAKPLFL